MNKIIEKKIWVTSDNQEFLGPEQAVEHQRRVDLEDEIYSLMDKEAAYSSININDAVRIAADFAVTYHERQPR